MNKIVQRLLIFFVGLPLVVAIVALDAINHLALHLVMISVSLLAANEMYNLFSRTSKLLPKKLLVFFSGLLPVIAFITTFFHYNLELITYSFIFELLAVLAISIFSADDFKESNNLISSSVFVILYSGYLCTFISRMTLFHNSAKFIATFLVMVFMNDSVAWFFGNLFGKNNRGIVKASPNKSVAGFIGGTLGSILAGIIAKLVWSDVFSGSIAKIILLAIIIAISGSVGDLAESVFKRSSGCKDSGAIVPGRGGILDSIDSVLMAAPVFYALSTLMYSVHDGQDFYNNILGL